MNVPIRSKATDACLAGAVGAILCVAGMSHLSNPYAFLESVLQYDLLNARFALLLSLVLPWLEVAVAGLLILNIDRRLGFSLASCLALCFTLAQVTALARGLKIGCGCFGSLSTEPIGAKSLSIATGLMLASVFGLWHTVNSYRGAQKSQLQANVA